MLQKNLNKLEKHILFYLIHKKDKFMINMVIIIQHKDNMINNINNTKILILGLIMQMTYLNNFLVILDLMMIMMLIFFILDLIKKIKIFKIILDQILKYFLILTKI